MFKDIQTISHLNYRTLRLKYTIILKWSFLNDHIKMTVYFTKNDDLILFHFNMKKLNMFNFLHIKMMKISFEIIKHHCFVLAATRNLHTCIWFRINIRLNKTESLVQQNLKDRFWILEQIKIYKGKGKKVFNQMATKTKNVERTKAFLEAFSDVFRT